MEILKCGFIDVYSPHWERVLSGINHDFYHLPEYVSLCARHERGEPVAFVAEQGANLFMVPLIIRPIDPAIAGGCGTLFDATSPYGYPGPLLGLGSGTEAEGFLGRAIAAFLDGLNRRRIVSSFVRLHPLFGLPQGPLGEAGYLVTHGETVSIDLMLPREEIWRQTRHNHRRNILKTEAGDYVALIDNTCFNEFISIYFEAMDRLGACDYYYFNSGYFEDLRTALGGRLHLGVIKIEGRVACAGLFTEVCGIVQYHLSGTRGEFLMCNPLKALINFVRYWAKDRGNRVFHLGGGLGGRKDSLFEFKAGFSGIRHPFTTWRILSNIHQHDILIERWRAASGAEADDPTGFFPAYRKPSILPGRLAHRVG